MEPRDVVIKKGVTVPYILKKFITDGFNDIAEHPTLRNSVLSLPSYDTSVIMKFKKDGGDPAGCTVFLNMEKFEFPFNRKHHTIPGFSGSIEAIQFTGPYINLLIRGNPMLSTRSNVAGQLGVMALSAIKMNWDGIKPSEHLFINMFASGNIYMTIRHGVKPRLTVRGNNEYKIPWHRNSNVLGDDKAFLTSGLYIHRPAYITPDSGGISFAKGAKQVRVFPEEGTVVTFFDQHVIHKVIPARINETNTNAQRNVRNHAGFVRRTAVFISWFTTSSLISRASGINSVRFRKIGIKLTFRNLKELYKLLKKYFDYIHSMQQKYYKNYNFTSLEELLVKANQRFITGIYSRHEFNQGDYSNIVALSGKNRTTTTESIPNLVLYKMVNNGGVARGNRGKLLDLLNVYQNLESSFGRGRGGRNQLSIHSANFVRANN